MTSYMSQKRKRRHNEIPSMLRKLLCRLLFTNDALVILSEAKDLYLINDTLILSEAKDLFYFDIPPAKAGG
jgi:hypothetical protein